jgi:hypothetical protein
MIASSNAENIFDGRRLPMCYFPGTSNPVPSILTEEETIKFLRLDETGIDDPGRTLRYYRSQGLLRARQIGRSIRYPLWELLSFVDRLDQHNPR